MNSKTAKLIARCAPIQGRKNAALQSEWLAATPRQRGKLRSRWLHNALHLVAHARSLKTEREAAGWK